jgi:hypothetical protein
VVRDQGKVEFQIGYADLAAADVAKTPLDTWFNHTLASLRLTMPGNTVAGPKDLKLLGHPGKEWTITAPNKGTLVVRVYGVKRENGYRLFLLTAQGPGYTANTLDVRKFFLFFRLRSPRLARPGGGARR